MNSDEQGIAGVLQLSNCHWVSSTVATLHSPTASCRHAAGGITFDLDAFVVAYKVPFNCR